MLPSHITGIISLALIALALLAHYGFHFSGAWRSICAVSMGVAVTTGISYEDKDGHWHDEIARGGDRPDTEVKG